MTAGCLLKWTCSGISTHYIGVRWSPFCKNSRLAPLSRPYRGVTPIFCVLWQVSEWKILWTASTKSRNSAKNSTGRGTTWAARLISSFIAREVRPLGHYVSFPNTWDWHQVVSQIRRWFHSARPKIKLRPVWEGSDKYENILPRQTIQFSEKSSSYFLSFAQQNSCRNREI